MPKNHGHFEGYNDRLRSAHMKVLDAPHRSKTNMNSQKMALTYVKYCIGPELLRPIIRIYGTQTRPARINQAETHR